MTARKAKPAARLSVRSSAPSLAGSLEANAFLLGLVFNQGQNAERSWQAPRELFERLGTSSVTSISKLDEAALASTIAASPALHRFPRTMARYVLGTTRLLCTRYRGDARKIWQPSVGLKDLLDRLSDFPGIGSHKAEVGVFFLTMEHQVAVKDDGTRIDLKASCPRLVAKFFPLDDHIELPLIGK
ncbi:hypothetical protein [Bradyrhizobium sp. HKCCYLRH1030]|uniref:hypothetical protein n=1 Tax=Bradyrhizobium sp. HKCCYLRH1030 TaxID=3420744 RepID=UPI003EB8C418